VHIYRFISQHTVEEAMLRKANQKRSLDDLVIQRGEFDWRSLFRGTGGDTITRALEDFADHEDARAARIAAQEAGELEGADAADFGEDAGAGLRERAGANTQIGSPSAPPDEAEPEEPGEDDFGEEGGDDEADEEGGTVVDYMLAFVRFDLNFFRDWRM
jgi:helicase SWR1